MALGRTGLPVSRVGLGLAALGRPGYINLGHGDDLAAGRDPDTLRQQTWTVLDAAWASGVRYFDAARSYGRGEEYLAGWLADRGVRPDQVVVGSKWGYTYTAGWQVTAEHHEVKDHTLPVLRRQWAESRQLLGPYLKLYQIHSATLDSGVLDDAAVLAELARLKGEGVHVGLTLSGPRQVETLLRALAIRVDGQPLFECVQATWNLLEPSAGPALREAHDAGWGVIVKEALANGRLTERNTEPAFADQRRLLERLRTPVGGTTDALALAAVLAQPWADVVLSGAATVEQLRSNLGALDLRWDAESLAEAAALSEEPTDYWTTRGRMAWN